MLTKQNRGVDKERFAFARFGSKSPTISFVRITGRLVVEVITYSKLQQHADRWGGQERKLEVEPEPHIRNGED